MVEGDTPPVNATALSIRKRYNHGKASNDVAEAGLLVHCFDGTEGADAPWKPCTTGTCNQFQWWWSASFINLVQLANPNPNPKPNPNPDPTPTPNPNPRQHGRDALGARERAPWLGRVLPHRCRRIG